MDERPSEPGLYDSHGRWVPRRLIKEVDLLRHETVLSAIVKARLASETLREAKAEIIADLNAFVALSAEQYGVELRGMKGKGNVTLMSHDGRYKIVRQIHERLAFDERLQVAKALVDQCITAWTEDSGDEVRALIEHAFQVDKAGAVSTERVLGLRKLRIQKPEWLEAMAAIADSVHVASSTAYVRFYERVGDSDEYVSIPLDFASV